MNGATLAVESNHRQPVTHIKTERLYLYEKEKKKESGLAWPFRVIKPPWYKGVA